MANKEQSNSSKIAGKIYDVSDYKKENQLSSGLAETHEQVSDTYMEGEIGGTIKRKNGSEDDLPRGK